MLLTLEVKMNIKPVNRVDLMIKRVENKHKKYLDIDIAKLMSEYKFGGLYANDRIELHSMPETATTVLEKLKIVFEKFKR
jgi:hypothetical protein